VANGRAAALDGDAHDSGGGVLSVYSLYPVDAGNTGDTPVVSIGCVNVNGPSQWDS